MSLAAADVAESSEDLLTIAVRHRYGSTEAFDRAFRAVHGTGPTDARRGGGAFRSQQQLRFRLTVEASTPMQVRISHRPAIRLAGHAPRRPLVHEGANPDIHAYVAATSMEEFLRLRALRNTPPTGLLQISDDLEPDGSEGSELSYMHGVAVTHDTPVPDDVDSFAVPAASWAVFTTEGPHPQALQDTWAATAAEWFPSNAWRLRPGPSIVAVLEHDEEVTVATCELWLPVERD